MKTIDNKKPKTKLPLCEGELRSRETRTANMVPHTSPPPGGYFALCAGTGFNVKTKKPKKELVLVDFQKELKIQRTTEIMRTWPVERIAMILGVFEQFSGTQRGEAYLTKNKRSEEAPLTPAFAAGYLIGSIAPIPGRA
ncbi:MAG: hypothetical protein ABSF37_03095 [Sedimentisphaerales bacterium]